MLLDSVSLHLSERTLTLVVGDSIAWEMNGYGPPDIEGFHFADVTQLTPQFIRDVAPQVVLSTLVTRNFDALEIARKLGAMHYEGAYRVLTSVIPDPDPITAEVKAAAPNLDFGVIDISKVFPDI